MNHAEINYHAKRIWDYHHMNHKLEHADCILGLGSHDVRVAERAAELYLDGWAPIIVFSGGLGNFTLGNWDRPEADIFKEVALKAGVPEEKILVENNSTNSGENIINTRELLAKEGIHPERFILVQKPYMERRAYATFKKNWPGKHAIVTSPQISYDDYPTDKITREDVINIIVGDLQRIKLYPKLGFQIHQDIPEEVWESYNFLVAAGFTNHCLDS